MEAAFGFTRMTMPQGSTRLFVYGSLLRGEPNHPLIVAAPLVRPARTARGFRLVSLGGFPGMIVEGDGDVLGEVYDVGPRMLASLDRLEGHPSFYCRIEIALEDGSLVETYLLPTEKYQDRPPVPQGDWRGFRAKEKV
jgi:gamma-glutamylcyclotransferase (GGCT)/AIG2-like uncharacterized protein YtfP